MCYTCLAENDFFFFFCPRSLTLVCLKCDFLADASGADQMTEHLLSRPNHSCQVIMEPGMTLEHQPTAKNIYFLFVMSGFLTCIPFFLFFVFFFKVTNGGSKMNRYELFVSLAIYWFQYVFNCFLHVVDPSPEV